MLRANQIQALLVAASGGLKSELCGLSRTRLVEKASRFRLGATPSDVEADTKFALRSVARRYQHLSEEIGGLDEQLNRLIIEVAPGRFTAEDAWQKLARLYPPQL